MNKLAPEHQSTVPILFNDEDLAQFTKKWGPIFRMATLTPKEIQSLLTSLRRGLLQLGDVLPSMLEWVALTERLRNAQTVSWSAGKVDGSSTHNARLVRLLVDQPSTSLTEVEQRQCLGLAALAFLNSSLGTPLTDNLVHGLSQQFKSKTDGWQWLRNLDCLDSKQLAMSQTENWPQVTREYSQQLEQLLCRKIPSPGALLGRLGDRDVTESDQTSASDSSQEDLPDSTTDATKPAAQVIKPDDISVNFDLFTFKILRDCQAASIQGYRLPLHWEYLSPDELKRVLDVLVADLKNADTSIDAIRRRTHAAARIVSLIVGLSLKQCLRLPLGRKGTIHLNLSQGVIQRDSRKVAPRKIRSKKLLKSGRWWRTVLPVEAVSVLNDLVCQFPDARTIGDLLHAVGLDHRYKCQDILNAGCQTSHPPEDSRFAQSLRPALLHLGVHPSLVARLTGDILVTPAAAHYYLSFSESQCHTAMSAFYAWAGLTAPPPLLRDWSIGSPKTISIEDFSKAVRELQQRVLRARNSVTTRAGLDVIVEFHNLYTCSVALQIIWSIGGRGDLLKRMSIERIFIDESLMCISDKRMDRYSSQRICPSSPVITQTRKHYIEHIHAFYAWLQRHSVKTSSIFDATGSKRRRTPCAFQLYCKDGENYIARPLAKADLISLCLELGISDVNVPRHFLFNELVRLDVCQPAIDSLMGQHINGSEPHGFSSGLSIRACCNYLLPILQDIHSRAGFQPLVGLGRTAQRYLALPKIPISASLQSLPNTLLEQKLKADDLLIAEAGVINQDPPVDGQTLMALSYLSRMQKAYVSGNWLKEFPAGSVLFCLVAFEMVLTEPELQGLYDAGVGNGLWAIDRMAVVESTNGHRPTVQRLCHKHTLFALTRTRSQNSPTDFSVAKKQLNVMLQRIGPSWPVQTMDESVDLFLKVAAHSAAIELPGTSTFPLFHKAPFAPAADLSRIFYGRPNIESLSSEVATVRERWRHGSSANEILKIVKRFGDRDLPIGEELERRKELRAALLEHQQSHALDEADTVLIEIMLADISDDPPYLSLKTTSLPGYARKYSIFCSFLRREETKELDGEVFREVIQAMGGHNNATESNDVRWALLHICSYLHRKGFAVPSGFHSELAVKINRLPRLPVYTTMAEIELAAGDIQTRFSSRGSLADFGVGLLHFHREVPTRAAESRYLRPSDIDEKAGLVHITSTAHNHLKNPNSRGSIALSRQLNATLSDLKHRRLELDVGASTLLFAESQRVDTYTGLDEVIDYSRQAVIQQTGRRLFRWHDLRSSSSTDRVFDLPTNLNMLAQGCIAQATHPTSSDIVHLHQRAAHAASAARHSPLTFQRYYNCSGLVELASYLRQAQSSLQPNALYVSTVLGKGVQAIHSQSSRRHLMASVTPETTLRELLDLATDAAIALLPTPLLAEKADLATETVLTGHTVDANNLMISLLLSRFGYSHLAASDAMHVPLASFQAIESKCEHMRKALRVELSTRTAPVLESALAGKNNHLFSAIEKYAFWLVKNAASLQKLQAPLLSALSGQTASIHFKSRADFDQLKTLLNPWAKLGFKMAFRPGRQVMLSLLPDVALILSEHGVSVRDDNSRKSGFGSLSFLLAPPPSTKPVEVDVNRASPRSFGLAGSLVISGILYALNFQPGIL